MPAACSTQMGNAPQTSCTDARRLLYTDGQRTSDLCIRGWLSWVSFCREWYQIGWVHERGVLWQVPELLAVTSKAKGEGVPFVVHGSDFLIGCSIRPNQIA